MLVLIGLYVLSCYAAIESYEAASTGDIFARPISLESILRGQYSAKHMNATWMSDYELIYRDDNVGVELNLFVGHF